MVNYQNAKIYKIINDSMPELVYYGSTCNTFNRRLNNHKNNPNKCSSKVLFEYGKPQMILIEKYPCKDLLELKQRERFYIENNECINKVVPLQTKKEWKEANRLELCNKQKEYYKQNSTLIKTKHSTVFKCDCGGKYTYAHKSRHIKSKKHLKFIELI